VVLVGNGETRIITRRTFDRNYEEVLIEESPPSVTPTSETAGETLDWSTESVLQQARGIISSQEEVVLFLLEKELGVAAKRQSLEVERRLRDNNRQAFVENLHRLKGAVEAYEDSLNQKCSPEYLAAWIGSIRKYIEKMVRYYTAYLRAKQNVEEILLESIEEEEDE